MLPIKQIFIDSRFKSSSERHSNFTIDLPTTLLIPDDAGFYIEDACTPHTWYPVNTQALVIYKLSTSAMPLNILILFRIITVCAIYRLLSSRR